MSLKNKFEEHLKQFSTAPFLFVGSGLSRRYLGLETWFRLLEKFTDGTGKSFAYYRSAAESNAPKIASALAVDFREMWFREDRFAESRKTNEKIVISRCSPLKIEISEYIKQMSLGDASENYKPELDLLRASVVDGIITTNWDTLLETLFPEFSVYIGQNNMMFSQQLSIAEIYKIHGCCSDPNSLVLTHEDYEEFNKRNPYLAARLLSVFIEHPVLFLGYSISDEDIQEILLSIVRCLTTDNIDKLANRLIFVEYVPDSEGEISHSSLIIDNKSLPVTVIKAADFAPIYEVLGQNKRKYPAQLLRRLKQQVYQLVLTTEPQERMSVVDIDDDTDAAKIEVVFGVGVTPQIGRSGYRPISKLDILRDVVFGGNDYDARQIIKETLPPLIRLNPSAAWPIFKYLKEGDYISSQSVVTDNFDENINNLIRKNISLPTTLPSRKQQKIASSLLSIEEMSTVNNLTDMIGGLLAMPSENVCLDDLQKFLQDKFEEVSPNMPTSYRNLVRRYDYLRYGKSP